MSRLLAFFDRHEVVISVAVYTGLVYYVLDRFVPAVGTTLFALVCTFALVVLVVSTIRARIARKRAARAVRANLARGAAQ